MRLANLSIIGCLLCVGPASAADLYALEGPIPAITEPGGFEARFARESVVPSSSWFVGLGGSFNTVDFDQDMYAAGTGDVYEGDTLVAVGQASGPANPRHGNELTLAPAAQLGYFAHLGASNWMLGAKFLYQYSAATASTRDIVPQYGTLDTIDGPDTFTGNVVIGSYRTRLNHEIAFMPFVGHSFARSYIYLGAGPALFQTKTNIDNATGFADYDGMRTNVTGTPVDFESSQWTWGGAAQIGLAYYLNRNWFLDFNYTYARSAEFTSNFSSPFSHTTLGYQVVGDLFVSPSQRVTDQSFMITVNRGF